MNNAEIGQMLDNKDKEIEDLKEYAAERAYFEGLADRLRGLLEEGLVKGCIDPECKTYIADIRAAIKA